MRRTIVRASVVFACGAGAALALPAGMLTAGLLPSRLLSSGASGVRVVDPVPAAASIVGGDGLAAAREEGTCLAEPDRLAATRLVGLVVPAAEAVVRARVDGFVARRLKRVGDPVESGQDVALLDDADLRLERERLAARAAGAAQRCAAATAELRLLELRGRQLRTTAANGSAQPFELTQNQFQAEAAAARLKALQEECREADADSAALGRRLGRCACVAPMAGRVSELARAEGDYVRTGEAVATVESSRRHVLVRLPAPLAGRAAALSFRLERGATPVALSPADGGACGGCDPYGGRSVALELPAGAEIEPGQTVDVEVVTR
jgi:multidrug efflux pump subunit AcrA (membrane-fusion protein)